MLQRIFFLGLSLTTLHVFAQEPVKQESKPGLLISVTSDDADQIYRRHMERALVTSMEKAFQPESSGIYVLNVAFEVQDCKTVEGMDTKTFCGVHFEATLTNALLKKTVFTEQRDISGSATNRNAAIQSVIKKYAGNGDFQSAVAAAAARDIDDVFYKDCERTLRGLPEQGSAEDLTRALAATEYLLSSTCADAAERKTDLITAKLDEITCTEDLHEMQVMVGSGQYNPKEMLSRLLEISPTAPCADEVIALARQMGEQKASGMHTRDREVLEQYILIYTDHDLRSRVVRYRTLRRTTW